MSFLFDKKTKNTMKWIWIFASIIIILSMTLVFSGGQGVFGGGGGGHGGGPPQQQLPQAETFNTQTQEPAVSSSEPVPFEINVPGMGGHN